MRKESALNYAKYALISLHLTDNEFTHKDLINQIESEMCYYIDNYSQEEIKEKLERICDSSVKQVDKSF